MTLALRSSLQHVLSVAMVAAIALCCMLSFAPRAQAAAVLSSDQLANIQQLLQSYGVDPQHINAVTSVLQDASAQLNQAQQTLASSSPCMAPLHALSRGMMGEDVKTLQQRLVDDGFLSSDNETGFFGSTTQAALQAWQAQMGIVASGTPATTGWGQVGQKTLAALSRCQMHIDQIEQHLASTTDRINTLQNNLENRLASTTERLQHIQDRVASTTQHLEQHFGSSTIPGMPNFPGFTPGPQSSSGQVGQFLSDYSDAFNQNLAAVASAPFNFYVPMLSDFFNAIGLD